MVLLRIIQKKRRKTASNLQSSAVNDMTLYSKQLIYPEGDTREVERRLTINQIVDLNGLPLNLPLSTDRMIVYRVYKITTDTPIGEEVTNYHLELVKRNELIEIIDRGYV